MFIYVFHVCVHACVCEGTCVGLCACGYVHVGVCAYEYVSVRAGVCACAEVDTGNNPQSSS